MKYITKFTDHAAYTAAESSLVEPNVSYCVNENEVHYKPIVPPYQGFCKLTLNDDSVVELEGGGELTSAMTSGYSATCVSAEIGTLCTSIGKDAFNNCSGLTSITIPSGVTSIGQGVFAGCTNLTNITIPNSVTSIGLGAFAGCSSLTSVTIGSGVTSIGSSAFVNCSSLASVTIPSGVTSIGDSAFAGCSSLTSVTIANSVTSIGVSAFHSCSNLSTITSHIMNAPSVNPGTFASVKANGTLYVPVGSSGYETWMNDQGNLGLYGWTKVEQ